MTIGIGMILDNSVLLWADGRLSRFAENTPVVADDQDKIDIIGSNLALMTAGVEMLGEQAVANFRLNYKHSLNRFQIADLTKYVVETSWRYFTVAEGFEMHDPSINCGFLVAGHDVDRAPFLILAQQLYQQPVGLQITTESYQFAVNCSDPASALSIVARELDERLTDAAVTGSYTDYLEQVIAAGADAIRSVGESDPFVGGTIRCAISNRGTGFVKQILPCA